MILDTVLSLGAQAGLGQTTLSAPKRDLEKARGLQQAYNGSGMPQPLRQMGGGLGGLSRTADARSRSPFSPINQMDEPLFSSELKVNTPHPVSRLSKPLALDIPSPSIDELVFYKQDDPRGNQKVMRVDNAFLQYNAFSMVNAAQWNMIVIGEQLALYNSDSTPNKEVFKQLTPKEVYFKWRLEGIVEQNGQGVNSSLFTKSMRNNEPMNILTKGHCTINSYWPRAEPGDDAYIVVKKMDYNPNFCLNTKDNNSSSGAGQRRMSSNLPFRPIQMGFYSSRRGAVPPMALYECTDDDGTTRYDGHVVRVGTIHFKAGGTTLFNQTMGTDCGDMDCDVHAYVDSNEGKSRSNYTPMKLIFDHNNGIYPLQ
jgi:hypothetical protein